MQEQVSKRTKSRHASPSPTPKISSKKGSSKAAKTPLRPKPVVKSTAKKLTAKPAVPSKKAVVSKRVTTKKATTTKKPAVTVAPVSKKTLAKSLPEKIGKKASVKVQVKASKPIKPKVKVATVPVFPKRVTKSAPKSPVISRHQLATQALRAFEQAVKVFNLREFSEAKALFEELQKHYQQEVEIIARSQTYIQVCNVRLANNRSLPRNADEFYDRGVVALNVGNFVQARMLFEKALKLRPGDSYTLYSLAATHAQAGATDQALTYLKQAVQKQPRLRQRALNDADFSLLKEDRRFLELLGATSPFDLLEARREIS